MSEHDREMTYLRQFIAHDDTAERHSVEKKITQAERDERCLRRAMRLMVVLVTLAVVGLGYSAILLDDYPHNVPRFFTHYMVKLSCALGLASLISLLGFVGVWTLYRRHLGEQREECRRLAAKVLASRLSGDRAVPASGLRKEREVPGPENDPAVSESQT
jgi:hypothetical protein